ncbi:MAG TPA: DUF2845 domain-containing protein [Steroidobacteraceae bacterium]|nr:DUF2845 domain-containing protein [Steroidobacteraceae bacterium]
MAVRTQTQATEQFTPERRNPTLLVAMSTFLLVLGGLVTAPVFASDLLRCGSKVISEGDFRNKLGALCGTPNDIMLGPILQRPSYMHQGRVTSSGDQFVQGEAWTYHFGPQRLMHRLRFVNGTLESIETLGHGHHSVGAADR